MKKVLFLCTGNSARSQMAEGFLKHMAGDRFEAYSAGVKPAAVNPLAIKVMAEIGIDILKHRSKSAMEFIGQSFDGSTSLTINPERSRRIDYVVTVCGNAQRTCPVFPGGHEKIHWDLEDPALSEGSEEDELKVFRKIRDEIEGKIKDWIKRPD